MRVMVVGAGIGGLTTALALEQVGIDDVVVVESVREIRPLGVGINLLPHAVRELDALGLAADLAAASVETADLSYFDRFGSPIWTEPRGTAAGYRWPQFSIHRGRLQLLLLDHVRRRLGADRVICGARVESATTGPDGATVQWRDDGGRCIETADVVVAADGIRSAVRAQRHPDEGPPRWNGSVLWRGVSRMAPFLSGRSMIMAGSRDQKFVAYPIEDVADDGTQLINWIAERLSPDSDALNQDWSRRVDKRAFSDSFDDWSFEWLDIPQLIDRADDIFEYPMVDRAALPAWNDGRVTLLGDAAHATYPIGSNGSSQAIIDARVLAFALATMPIDEALAYYEGERLPKTAELQRVNRELGPERVMQLTHERAPDGFADIDDVIPLAERVEIAAAYKRVAGFDPDVLNALPSWTPPPVPALEPCGLLEVQVGEPMELAPTATGVRRAVPILGGRMSGEIGDGEILGGWDWQTVHADGTLAIDATYPVRLDDGVVVTVATVGVRDPRPSPPYFRLAVTISDPVDETGDDAYLLVGSGIRAESTVTIAVYRVT